MLKNEKTAQNYINDLEETWLLNIDLFDKMIYSLDQGGVLAAKLRNIKALYFNKQKLLVDKENFSGKLLVNRQVYEEERRRLDEIENERSGLLEDMQENIANKDTGIQEYYDKFKEVDIYLEKEIRNNKDSGFQALKWFKINNFINENTELKWKKEQVNNIILEHNQSAEKLTTNNNVVTERLSTEDLKVKAQDKMVSIFKTLKKKIEEKRKLKKQLKKQLEYLEKKIGRRQSIASMLLSPIKKRFSKTIEADLAEDSVDLSVVNESKFNFSILRGEKKNPFEMLNKDDWDISVIQ